MCKLYFSYFRCRKKVYFFSCFSHCHIVTNTSALLLVVKQEVRNVQYLSLISQQMYFVLGITGTEWEAAVLVFT